MLIKSDRTRFEFWNRPDVAPSPDTPFAFKISNEDGHEMGVWFNAEDIKALIKALHAGLNGATKLGDY